MKKTFLKFFSCFTAAVIAGAAFAPAAYCIIDDDSLEDEYSYTDCEDVEPVEPDNEVSSETLKKILSDLDGRIDVPKNLTEITCLRCEDYYDREEFELWFRSKDTQESDELYIRYRDGIVVEYNMGLPDLRIGLVKLTDEEFIKKASEHIEKLNPFMKLNKNYKLEIDYISAYKSWVGISINRYHNGIKVDGNYGTIRLDKNTGKLNYFFTDWDNTLEFADASEIKSIDELCRISKESADIQLYYDNSNENVFYKIKPVTEIHAVTGEPYKEYSENSFEYLYDDLLYYYRDLNSGHNLIKEHNLLTAKQVTDILRKNEYLGLADEFTLAGYSVYEFNEGEYLGYFVFCNSNNSDEFIYIMTDMKSGQLLEYYREGYKPNSDELDVFEINKIADGLVKSLFPNEEFVPYDFNFDKFGLYENVCTYVYSRAVNGVYMYNDYFQTDIDKYGVVVRIQNELSDDVKYEFQNIISDEEAFDKFFSKKRAEVYYAVRMDDNNKFYATPVCSFGESKYINAKTGEFFDPDNANYQSYEMYLDIEGIPQENAIRELVKHSVIYSRKYFCPDEKISDYEFYYTFLQEMDFKYLGVELSGRPLTYIKLYKMIENGGGKIKRTNEQKPFDTVTRAEAAQIIYDYLKQI